MKTHDFGLRYVSPRRWCWRAEDGSWRKTHKWAAELYLGIEHGLSKRRAHKSPLSPIDAVMTEVAANFRVDLAGDYHWNEEIRTTVDRFYRYFSIDAEGLIRAGEYKLPDGRRILLTDDIKLGLMA
jgi:hypothetical protein